MSTVGIRALKAKLSEVLRRVRKGEVVVVTDRGTPVAEIRRPVKKSRLPPELAGLQRLIDEGLVSEGGPNDPKLYPPAVAHVPPGIVQRILDELREDRC
jgi:antitoxin (DNA-binding transcriptional repressor) of toxin-antitoxin stability system